MATDPRRPQIEKLALSLLVLRCQAGDEAAFARLFAQFGPRTLRYLQRLVGDDAEDVGQDVWLGVYRRIGQLATPAAFVTWLFRLTRNQAVDWLRQRRRMRELLDDVTLEHDSADAGASAADESDTLDVEALSSAIAALPAVHREAMLLRHQEELSYAEIASVVGCSIGTVKSRLHHARRQLRDVLAQEHPECKSSTFHTQA